MLNLHVPKKRENFISEGTRPPFEKIFAIPRPGPYASIKHVFFVVVFCFFMYTVLTAYGTVILAMSLI